MKNTRGVIVLIVAVICGLAAAKMVSRYLRNAEAAKRRPSSPQQATLPPIEPRTPPFTRAIPNGMRAVSIPVTEVTGVSRRVKRGDRVDVIAITAAPGEDNGKISRLLLQAVEVLAAAPETTSVGDNNIIGSSRQAKKKWVVTLLLTPQDATAITAADASSKLALLVRNPKDLEAGNESTVMVFTNRDGVRPFKKRSPPASMPDVRELIKPGMRAFTLEAKVTDGASGSIRPGDCVDIMLTCPFGHFATSNGHDVGAEGRITSTHMASRIFLQNIEVLAVADQQRLVTKAAFPTAMPLPAGTSVPEVKTEIIKSVVLHVTPRDAELLTVATDATSRSIIRLLLRNPDDHARVRTKGQLLIELLTEKREYTSVEIVRGNEQTTKKFFQYTKGGIATRSEALTPRATPKTEKKANP